MERGTSRRYPIGAELIGPNQTHFRIWAPKAQDVDLVLEESAKKDAKRTFHPLEREDGGYFSGVANAGAGALYRFRVNQAEHFHPDRRFPGKFRMGLRWSRSFRAISPLRNAGRSAPIYRPRALVRPGCYSRRRLQPFRARRKLSCGLFERLPHPRT